MKTYVLAGGVLLVGAAAVFYFSGTPDSLSGSRAAAQTAPALQMAVAAHPLKAGHFFSRHDIKWVNADPNTRYTFTPISSNQKIDHLEGAVLRQDISAGEAITADELTAKDAPEFMSAVLGPGKRAFTIEVNSVTGGAGLLRPGNRVDVILSASVEQPGREATRTAKTLLQNLRVIAVDTTIDGKGFRSTAESGKRGLTSSRGNGRGTITLEADPKQVEILTVARSVGELSLSLRDLYSTADTPVDSSMTTSEQILPPASPDQAPVKRVKAFFGKSANHP